MELLLGPPMAKAGRPKKDDPETKMVRLFFDLAEMMADLALVLPKSVAQIADPLLRPEITKIWEKCKPQIEKVKAAKKAAEETFEESREQVARIIQDDERKASRKKPGS